MVGTARRAWYIEVEFAAAVTAGVGVCALYLALTAAMPPGTGCDRMFEPCIGVVTCARCCNWPSLVSSL